MLKKFRQNLAWRFGKNEQFFIAEMSPPARILATEARVDFKNKKMLIFPSVAYHDPASFAAAIKKSPRAKLIFSFDPALGATVYSALAIRRENPSKVIDEAEADNLASHAMRKFFADERPGAAHKMRLDPAEVVLAAFVIRDIELDGHRLISAAGLAGREIILRASGTMIPKTVEGFLDKYFFDREIGLLSEKSASIARIVFESRRHLDKKDFLFADVSTHNTQIFSVGRDRIAYNDDFGWGYGAPRKAIADHFSIGDEMAGYVNAVYNSRNPMSKDFSKKIDSLVAGEYNLFMGGLGKAIERTRLTSLFLRLPPGAPEEIWKARFKNAAGRYAKPALIPQETFHGHFDFVVQLKKGAPTDADHIAAHILDYYIAPTEKMFNELALRRLRWLKKSI